MKRRARPTGLPLGMIQALSALYSSKPLTDDERRDFQSKVAHQKRRDELARQPSPQLELDTE